MTTLPYFEVQPAGLSSMAPLRSIPGGIAQSASSTVRSQSKVRPTTLTVLSFQNTREQAMRPQVLRRLICDRRRD